MKNILTWVLFNESANIQILPISTEEIEDITKLAVEGLKDIDSEERVRKNIGRSVSWDISVKCVLDGKLIGCYLFSKEPINGVLQHFKLDYEKYLKLKGFQGFLLLVLPEYRNIGAGKKLRDYSLKMPYDYIWGFTSDQMKNIDKWTTFGRKVIHKFEDPSVPGNMVYLTEMDLKHSI